MKNCRTRIVELLEEVGSYLGMIAEVEAKVKLCKNRIKEEGLKLPELRMAIDQMNLDFDKYSRKIVEIYRELQKYGVFHDLD